MSISNTVLLQIKHFIPTLVIAVICGSSIGALEAQEAAKLLPFQGRLTDQNGVAVGDGVKLIQFKIYPVPTDGTPVWAGEIHRTTVNGGLVNVLLGTKTPLTSVIFEQQLYLEITMDVNDDGTITAADPPMLPRQVILPTLFAQESRNSSKLLGFDWSAILVDGSKNPQTGKIDGAKIADSTITGQQIALHTIGLDDLSQSVTDKLDDILLEIEQTKQAITSVGQSVGDVRSDVGSLNNRVAQLESKLQAIHDDLKNPWVLITSNVRDIVNWSQEPAELAHWEYAVVFDRTFLRATVRPGPFGIISTEYGFENNPGKRVRHSWAVNGNFTSYWYHWEEDSGSGPGTGNWSGTVNIYRRRR